MVAYNFELVKPGKYIFRMIRDNNRNKEWDTGNYLKKYNLKRFIKPQILS